MLSSNSNSSQSDSTVNNKSLTVNIDHYPFEQTYNQNDLNGNYTGFLPVTVTATGVPNYTKFYADIDGQIFQQPIQYDGKYKFVLKNDGSGLMPQYIQDQNTNNYDLNIKIKPESNTATLTIDDTVLNIIRNNPLYHGILTLPDRDLNAVTLFNTNGKDYATALEIDLSNVTLPNMKSGTVITKNAIYDVVNNDGNNDDIEFEEQNTPTPTPHLLLKKRDPLLRDDPMEDDSEVNLGSFTVNVPPPKINSPTTNNGFYKFNDNWNALTEGSSEDHDIIIQVPNTTETLTATQNNHTYTPSQGNVGFSSVTVEVPQPSVESTKTVTITENKTITITPSSNYDSIGQLEIITNIPSDVINQTLATITSNGTYTPGVNYSGFNSFTVNVPQPSIQSNKQITLTNNNSTVTIRPDNNYDALDEITITTNVPTTDTTINNQNVNSNNLITSNGFYAPDNQHTGFNAFTVAVPIQDNKTVNVNGAVGQTFSIFPDAGYEGLKKTTFHVIAPAYQSKTITSNGTYTPDANYDGFSSVTVNVSSSSTPKQISTLKLGSDGESVNTSSFTSVSSNGTFTVTPGDYIDEESNNTKYGFWILSYLIRNNSCWICLTNVYRKSNSSTVTVTNNSDVTAYYYVYNQRDVYFMDASSIIAYGNGSTFMSQTVGSSFDINTSNQNNIDLYPIDPSDPQYYTPPSFSLDCFTLPGGGNQQPDIPNVPTPPPPEQPMVYATQCELINPIEQEGVTSDFSDFSKIAPQASAYVDVNYIGVLIEENTNLYRFTLINGPSPVSPSLSDLTGAWLATIQNLDYTKLFVPSQDSDSRWEFDSSQYGEIPKDEIELVGLPN